MHQGGDSFLSTIVRYHDRSFLKSAKELIGKNSVYCRSVSCNKNFIMTKINCNILQYIELSIVIRIGREL